jgi:large subunit ribosomal protein L28
VTVYLQVYAVRTAFSVWGRLIEFDGSSRHIVTRYDVTRVSVLRNGLKKMARRDQLTGKGPVAGNHVSHAHNKAKRRFEVNIQKKRFYIPEEDRWVTLKVSATTIKTINKKGISAVLKEARQKGVTL